jgi:hypothetical protein
MKSERCAVYRWLFAQANSQTDGLATQEDLARHRVVNLANKLVEHHQVARQEVYEAHLKHLVFGAKEPGHFTFSISAGELERLLNIPCDEEANNNSLNPTGLSAGAPKPAD